MAGLCGLKILLLWAGIISLANCTSTTAPKPPLTTPTITSNSQNTELNLTNVTATSAPPASTSPSPKTNNTNQNQTSPPITSPSTTAMTQATPTTTQAPPSTTQGPQQCSHNVTAIKFGFWVDMLSKSTNSTNSTSYTISIEEKGQPGKPIIQSFSQSSHEIKHLKPCTEYKLTFIDSAGKEKPCETEITTLKMTQDDVKDGSCMSGYVCYQSDWDISSSLSPSNNISAEPCKSDIKEFCIKPGYNDICTNLTTTFTSENCGPFFSLNKLIPLDPSEIKQIVSTKFPVEIEQRLPPNCNNLTIDYTCQKVNEVNEPNPKKLSELEPFTDYSCTGQIKVNNVTVNHTTPVKFRIDCDLKIVLTKTTATNTSIQLSWNTTSQKCGSVLPDLTNLSYGCSCSPFSHKHRIPVAANANPSRGTCNIEGLVPHTNYFCEVRTKYNKVDVTQLTKPNPTPVKLMTEIGIPEDITSLTWHVADNNVIIVTCVYGKIFNGPQTKYVANLRGVEKKENKDKCSFEFKDLSYSTTYELEVTAHNEKFRSNPKRESVSTSSIIAHPRLIIFVIIAIILSVVVVVAVYKLYVLRRRNVVNEEVMLELSAIYANVPQSEDIR